MNRSAMMRRPGRLRLYYHYGCYLLWEFRWSLSIFWSLVFGGGLLLHACAKEPLPFLEACQKVFFLIFVEDSLAFPEKWYLQPLVFIIPIIGLGAVADSVIRQGTVVYRKA